MKTKVFVIHPAFPEKDKISQCAKTLRQGGLVVFPTETVYGVAANKDNKKAMKRLKKIKDRPDQKPFSVLVSKKEDIENFAQNIDTKIYKIIDKFWPGPLTIVIPSKEEGKTIGLRMPDNVIALNLAIEANCTIVAPSANKEGKPAPTTLEAALKELKGLVDIAVDGGPAAVAKESTVVDLTGDAPKMLREGAITLEEINKVARRKLVLFVCTGNSCRSVMAEYMLRRLLIKRDDVDVTSAGTSVFVSMGASSEAINILKKEGLSANMHRSKPITNILLNKSDLIFVMTRAHREQVIQMAPQVKKRTYLLREFSPTAKGREANLDIPDPIGRPPERYEECMFMIKEALDKIIDLI